MPGQVNIDTAGSYLVDHPRSRKAVARIVAGMVLVLPVAAAPAAVTDPGGIGQYSKLKPSKLRPHPGGIGQYRLLRRS